jgi:hypothetical protein
MLKKWGEKLSAWPEIKEVCLEYKDASVVPPIVYLLDMYVQDGETEKAVEMAEKLRVVDFTRERYWAFVCKRMRK